MQLIQTGAEVIEIEDVDRWSIVINQVLPIGCDYFENISNMLVRIHRVSDAGWEKQQLKMMASGYKMATSGYRYNVLYNVCRYNEQGVEDSSYYMKQRYASILKEKSEQYH